MSWQDRITDKLKIITGDGQEYNLLWRLGSKVVGYNVATFEFSNLRGTLVRKSKPKGKVYEIDVVFQGENHIDDYNAFEESCSSENPITMTHPVYGLITVQLSEMEVINQNYNVTEVRLSVQETIDANYPISTISIIDKVVDKNTELGDSIVDSVASISSSEKVTQKDIVDNYDNRFDALALIDSEKEKLSELTFEAKSKLNSIISTPAEIVEAVIELANFPTLVSASLGSVFSVIDSTINSLLLLDFNLLENKSIYEKNAGSLIGALCEVTTKKAANEFETRSQVLKYIQDLISLYNGYINHLDSIQSERADTSISYVPNFTNMEQLDSLINLSISSLFQVALDAKQERTVLLDDDSNVILLTQKYYGLDRDDANLDKFIATNKIGLSELLVLKKGRKITYFV